MDFRECRITCYMITSQIDSKGLNLMVVYPISVPQGSILGPLLFALYLNDSPIVVKYSIFDLYADDAELHCSQSDLGVVEAHIQSDLDVVAPRLHSSQLRLNFVKSNAMLIGIYQELLVNH